MLELLCGIVCLFAGVAGMIWVIRDGRRAADLMSRAAVVLQVAVVLLLLVDWGHSWVEMSGIDIVTGRFAWLALPHVLALVSLVGMLVYGPDFRGRAGVLATVQTGSLIGVMLLAEQEIDLSFLAPVPLVSLYLSAIVAFAFFGSSLVVLPRPDSFWYRFVFKPRENLLASIEALKECGFDVTRPETVFECGSASGWLEGTMVHISTAPSLYPLRYGLRIRIAVSRTWHGRRLPGFAENEKWLPGLGWIEYSGLSRHSFNVDPDGLRSFIRDVAGLD